jgi:hypothetical protein
MNNYLSQHNELEHNFHTDWEDRGFDICIECDLVRRTGGVYEWKEEELVTMEQYAKEAKI